MKTIILFTILVIGSYSISRTAVEFLVNHIPNVDPEWPRVGEYNNLGNP